MATAIVDIMPDGGTTGASMSIVSEYLAADRQFPTAGNTAAGK